MPYHYQKSSKKQFIAVLLIGITIGLISGYYIFIELVQAKTEVTTQYVYIPLNQTFTYGEINLAAVDQNGNGVTTPLVVIAEPGDGKTLTNIEKLLFWVDTQQSIQTARLVAQSVTGIDVNKYDLVYTVRINSTLVGGPSAGAALTIATIAALENKQIKSNVMITGTINPDGTIGEVGGILEKAQAAKQLGVKTFLVPEGQGTQTYLKPEETCVRRSGFLFCTTKYKQITTNIGQEAGIDVVEVGNINDALGYFF